MNIEDLEPGDLIVTKANMDMTRDFIRVALKVELLEDNSSPLYKILGYAQNKKRAHGYYYRDDVVQGYHVIYKKVQ